MAAFTTVEEMQAMHQRDLNRITDSDRNTRKRGLQKLLDDIQWTPKTSAQADVVHSFVVSVLLPLTVGAVADPIEKCRELALKILMKIVSCKVSLDANTASSVLQALSVRINDIPFPETAEELRLIVLQAMSIVIKQSFSADSCKSATDSAIGTVLPVLCKALQDNFPAARSEASDVVIYVAETFPDLVQLHFRPLLKSLIANVFHQHSKVRSITLKVEDNY